MNLIGRTEIFFNFDHKIVSTFPECIEFPSESFRKIQSTTRLEQHDSEAQPRISPRSPNNLHTTVGVTKATEVIERFPKETLYFQEKLKPFCD